VRIVRNLCNGEELCFLCGTDWILKYYLYVLRLQRVNRDDSLKLLVSCESNNWNFGSTRVKQSQVPLPLRQTVAFYSQRGRDPPIKPQPHISMQRVGVIQSPACTGTNRCWGNMFSIHFPFILKFWLHHFVKWFQSGSVPERTGFYSILFSWLSADFSLVRPISILRTKWVHRYRSDSISLDMTFGLAHTAAAWNNAT
jgi:hypothetical protein